MENAEILVINLKDMIEKTEIARFEFAENFKLTFAANEKIGWFNQYQNIPIEKSFMLSIEIYDLLK